MSYAFKDDNIIFIKTFERCGVLKSKQNIRQKAATILDVARLANVSKSAVSRHINKQDGVAREAEEKIIKAIDELKYKPNSIARALKAKATKSIGLIIPSIENPVFPPLIKVIEDTARRYGFSTILCNSEGSIEQEADYIELLVEKQVDGVIFNAMGDYRESFDILKNTNTPLVVIGRKIENFNTANITVDNFKGAFMAVEYLIKSGLKDIAFLSGHLESSTAINDRYEGYKAALEANGIAFNQNLVIREVRSFEGGIEAACELIARKDKFDSIFASNDIMAIGCMEKLMDCGYSIPHDISVIGYDDIPSARIIKPKLSTVLNPVKGFGVESVKALLRIIYTGTDSHIEKKFDPELVIRETTRQI